ncbi:MAG: hypothetical protein GXP49_03115 [Deltaproteobacteria bacterium]|nr:hypothetical protein [Deltaproteobacteria bacterium]
MERVDDTYLNGGESSSNAKKDISLRTRAFLVILGGAVCTIGISSALLLVMNPGWMHIILTLVAGVLVSVLLSPIMTKAPLQRLDGMSSFTQDISQAVAYELDISRGLLGEQDRWIRSQEGLARIRGKLEDLRRAISVLQGQTNQTDVLAINATLEATRTGEAGRGFALLATEFRRLAERVAASSERIDVLLKELSGELGDALDGSRTTGEQVFELVSKAGKNAAELENVVENLEGALKGVYVAFGLVPRDSMFTISSEESK